MCRVISVSLLYYLLNVLNVFLFYFGVLSSE